MLTRPNALVTESVGSAKPPATSGGEGELALAAAALLVEAARLDGHFDDEERRKIASLVAARFELSRSEAETLIGEAESHAAAAVELYGFTRVVKDRLSYDERVELIEMLWQVVYADGALHDYEASLLRRIAGLLYVEDRASGEARKRALEKLNLPVD